MEGDDSSNSNQQQFHVGSYDRFGILASCYMVETSSTAVKGFHYCTTDGAGTYCQTLPTFAEDTDRSGLRSTVVSLRFSRGLNFEQQALPSIAPPCLWRRTFGRETKGLVSQGRQRKPSRKSVRGSSATHCPPCSLVRGAADSEGRWRWVRIIKTFGLIARKRNTKRSDLGSNFGTTRTTLFIGGSSPMGSMGRRYLSSLTSIQPITASRQGTYVWSFLSRLSIGVAGVIHLCLSFMIPREMLTSFAAY